MHGADLPLHGTVSVLPRRGACTEGGAPDSLSAEQVPPRMLGATRLICSSCLLACSQYGAFCIMGCCASIVQVVGTALLVSKSDGFEQLAISIREEDGGGLGEQ